MDEKRRQVIHAQAEYLNDDAEPVYASQAKAALELLAALAAAEARAAAAEARAGRLEEALKAIMSLEASRPEVAGELIAYFRGIAHRALENLDPR